LAVLLANAQPAFAEPRNSHAAFAGSFSDRYFRTELYFGFGKKGGGEVTEAEWQRFITDEVTPRFTEGFTVLFAVGQYRSSAGMIVRETSRVLVFLYPKKQRAVVNARIEAIRTAYKRAFMQESVLRTDISEPIRVSF
jgi:hypothetical protein